MVALNSTQIETAVPLASQTDVVLARQTGREMAQGLGFGTADQTRLATAISELARNAVKYAGGGACTISDTSDQSSIKVKVVIEDTGPGIPDIEQAMADGFSTVGTLGAGLPGAKRLVQNFDIESAPGRTVVSIELVRPRSR